MIRSADPDAVYERIKTTDAVIMGPGRGRPAIEKFAGQYILVGQNLAVLEGSFPEGGDR